MLDAPARAKLRAILRAQGFHDPEPWLESAERWQLREVPAEKLSGCPDCRSLPFRALGQYVYYSHLVVLRECLGCGLVYADTRLPREVLTSHFEHAYKEDAYFEEERRDIFRQLVDLVARNAPPAGRVLDIGGATGLLMAQVKKRRPDLAITITDLSEQACGIAAARYGFATLCGGVEALADLDAPFDVVVLSDVIYYEPDIRQLWAALPALTSPGGTVLIRVPNKLRLIRTWQVLMRSFPHGWPEERTRIRFFNPEHLFIFSRSFLLGRLRRLGFTHVRAVPSRVLRKHGLAGLAGRLWNGLSRAAFALTAGRLIISPAMLVIASRSAIQLRPQAQVSAPHDAAS
jgi:2-polyprenyl-3-methyl-5-hydroxy-6-metoxy-1,4-benzoquinol methylase